MKYGVALLSPGSTAAGAVAALPQPYLEKPPCRALLRRMTNGMQQITGGNCSAKRKNGVPLLSPGSMAAGAVAALQQPYSRSSLTVPCCREGQQKTTINQRQLSKKRGNGVALLSPGVALQQPFLRSPLAVLCCQDDRRMESDNGVAMVMVEQLRWWDRQLQWCSIWQFGNCNVEAAVVWLQQCGDCNGAAYGSLATATVWWQWCGRWCSDNDTMAWEMLQQNNGKVLVTVLMFWRWDSNSNVETIINVTINHRFSKI